MNPESSSILWIVDYEVESFLAIDAGQARLEYRHPDGLYNVALRNLATDPGIEVPLLAVQIEFRAADIFAAEDISDDYLREFLDYLSLVSKSKYRIHRRKRLVDWTPGLAIREQFIYKAGPPDQPYPHLHPDILDTVSMLQSWESAEPMPRVLRWFSAGVSARVMEDQFQYFWYVIELIASAVKGLEKVPDRCPVCRGELFCPRCNKTPTHRPYPKQAIRQLISRTVVNEPDKLFSKLDAVRNMLMHGAH